MTPLQIALLEIGKQEIPRGSNWGEHVQKYLASVGISFPASWCMAFVYWCAEQARVRIPDITGGISSPLVRTGGVLRQWNEIDTRAQSLFRDKKFRYNIPQVGDVFIMDFGKGLGHCGFVENIDRDQIHTIEGNTTSETGSREGYEVCRRIRKISSCKGFIRLS
jgi:hypothetical protein